MPRPRTTSPAGGWAAFTAARRRATQIRRRELARQVNDLRLSQGRIRWGRVQLRFCPYVRTDQRGYYLGLRGQTLKVAVPESMDAWELLRDMYRFLKGWRPMRVRTEPQRLATTEVFAQWERLAAAVRDPRWT